MKVEFDFYGNKKELMIDVLVNMLFNGDVIVFLFLLVIINVDDFKVIESIV